MSHRMFAHYCILGFCAVTLAAWSSPAQAGPDWIEVDDAGSLLGNAQATVGDGPLNRISGSLTSGFGAPDFEDMFLITVLDPGSFSMTIASADFDAAIWVFNVTKPGEAFGLLGSTGTSGDEPFIGPFADDGSGSGITLPGVYAVAISAATRVPVSNLGEIFFFGDPDEVSGPDGPGGFNPHIGWTGEGAGGSYTVDLEGTGFYVLPGPSAGLLLFGLAFGARRRRSA